VHSLSDPRNAATAALYAALLWATVSSKPWQVLAHILYRSSFSSPGQHGKVKSWNASPSTAPAQRQRLSEKQQQQGITGASHDLERDASSLSMRHQEAAWQMVIVIGLVIGPFLPAANILFYVGTFIGERLLYLPSLGYCLLLSHYLMKLIGREGSTSLSFALSCIGLGCNILQTDSSLPVPANAQEGTAETATLLPAPAGKQKVQKPAVSNRSSKQQHKQEQVQQQSAQAGSDSGVRQQHDRQVVDKTAKWVSVRMPMRSWLGLALLCMLLTGYSWRTVTRNLDWEDEETLFIAAQKVS